MGSAAETVHETVEHMIRTSGEKVGVVKVRRTGRLTRRRSPKPSRPP